jgi:cytochrome c-type biogenesis protein CcmH/NrfG
MSAPMLRPTGQAAAETELLAKLGLPASASAEDIDQAHQAVSDFLSGAPPAIRGWARAQVAALDAAYINLTDPAGLEGSALMSPASPPAVVPGGPATPPARRGPHPAVTPVEASATDVEALDIEGEPSAEDFAALYAMVTPSAHDDMKPDARQSRASVTQPAQTPAAAAVPTMLAAPPTGASNVWKRIVIGALGVAVVVGIAFGANAVVNGGGGGTPAASQVAQATSGAPTVDLAKVGGLMTRLQANPNDIDALLALGTEYYNGGDFETAGTWFDKVLAIDPKNIEALLAKGAVYFNLVDFANAEKTWKTVSVLAPDNVEVHYDMGFLALNQTPPDWTAVQEQWNRVIALDPNSDLAKTVKSHLDSLAGSSMIPGESAGPSAVPAASPALPGASPAASPAASPSATPAASPAASTTP